MKKILIFLFIFILVRPVVPQESSQRELRIDIRNNSAGKTIQATLQLVSESWDAHLNDFNDHDLRILAGSSILTNGNNISIGWNICWVDRNNGFGLGKYKVKVNTGIHLTDYFYIDYRTSDLPEAYTSSDDIRVYLNANNGILYWNYELTDQVDTDYTLWGLSVIKGTNITWKTTELEPYPPDNFQLSSSGGYPYLTWSHSSNSGDYWTAYGIYRSVVSGGGGLGNFSKIATIAKTSTNYTDYDYAIHGPMTAYYKIAVINGERESEFTETLDIGVGFYKSGNDSKELSYKLFQNYPNPFNPTTSIKFAIKEDSFVTLEIFDILGNEVRTLVNSFLRAGNHSVEFDGNGVGNGIYIYKIQANNFINVKKLILLK